MTTDTISTQENLPFPEYSGAFEEVCARLGTPLALGGNAPFALEGAENCWLVQTGRVEVFAVPLEAGQPAKARHYIWSARPGQFLFGFNTGPYGEELILLAVPMADTRLLKLGVEHLSRMVKLPELAGPFITGLDEWLAGLTAGLMAEKTTPRTETTLEPGQEMVTQPAQILTPRKGGVWLKPLAGKFSFLGEAGMPGTDGAVYFPLYDGAWLEAFEDGKIEVATTGAVASEVLLWAGLEQFHRLFLRLKAADIKLALAGEASRLQKRVESDRTTGREALRYLATILEKPGGQALPQAGDDPRGRLLAACRLVGEAQGMTIQIPPNQTSASPSENLLNKIIRASRIRTRNVALETDWWKKYGGPLLAFLREGDAPVALLPTRLRSYELCNPADGRSIPVTATVAGQLATTAVIFYRPLPEKIRRARELVGFGLRGSRRDIIVTLILSAMLGLLALFVPVITEQLFDSTIPSGQRGLIWQVLLGLLVVAVSTAAFQIVRNIAVLRLESKADNSLQAALWDRLLALPTAFFRQYSVGDLASRASGFDAIRQLVGSQVIAAILGSAFSLFSFFLLFSYNLGLALVALALTLLMLVIIGLISFRQLRYQRELIRLQGKLGGLVLQLITGVAKLRVAGAEMRAFAVWARQFGGLRKVAFRARRTGNFLTVFNLVWPVVCSICLFGFVHLFIGRELSTGAFLAFIAAFGQFLVGAGVMAAAFALILQAVPVYERAKVILDAAPEISSGQLDPGELSGLIEINHVSFRYGPDSPYILNDVSLQFKPGQFVAIVGPSGAGKSSLFRLLLGFEKPESGTIYYDNHDLAELDIQAVRRQTGVVIQNGKLMPGDIVSNIVGSAPFTLDDAWQAARLAGVEKDIREMPMGMFTLVSEGGSTLSGGQRQRLMIARAIIGRPRLLLFDEATSALDNQTQAIVSKSLENLQATRVVIAHRLSTIVNADCIYVLQGGKIVQSGSYNELMAQEGVFRDLATRQLA